MSRGLRLGVAVVVLVLLGVAGWRTFTQMRADAALRQGDVALSLIHI